MRRAIISAALLLGAAPVPGEDAVVLRAALSQIGGQFAYCVTATLAEAPFKSYQRDISEYGEREPSEAERLAALRERLSYGWTSPAGKPLSSEMLARIMLAGVAVARRGDPTPLLPEAVGELNVTDASNVRVEPAASEILARADELEALADKAMAPSLTVTVDHGRIDQAWLAHGQRLAEKCSYPMASLSAVAREGDVAFVSVGLVWAELAGVGETWAMQRTPRGWQRVARRQDWVS